ncbi:FAD-dependent oxidoreductase [Nonomuraea candida]|uniref:FAD-dependent oxidoreductase n=1 Tax=Nonomuraea candida TaxID=359159 RepID=UPI0005B82B56|nr:FAD-dependent oxidoreductase [Nonomuraea candida]
MSETRTPVLVVGGGLGGVAAALTAATLGLRVVLTEETDWLGGQLTSQAVPPDEHPWIESRYASATYRRLRRTIRDYYRRAYPLLPEVAAQPLLNPGLGVVSPLCHEPRAALAAIDELLAPHRTSGRLTVLPEHRPVAVDVTGDRVEAVTFLRLTDGARVTVAADYVIDATELGDLLPLAGVEHVVGAEGVGDTGEPHAPAVADPLDQQAVSWCFPVEHRPGEDHTIDKPARYEHWRTHVSPFWPGPQLSWVDVEPIDLTRRERFIFQPDGHLPGRHDLWHYRRIVAASQHRLGTIEHDVTLVNWPQIDYWELPFAGPDADPAAALDGARSLSLSFLYWMQTEAPRPDGGTGYPGLRLRPDIVGTSDGLAKAPYIREARRIKAEFTVLEQHIGVEARGAEAGSEVFHDAVGIGSYRIDLHPSTAGRTYVDIDCFPFQIPLGALLPQRVDNLLPAGKNIGTTHITNGAYRLHPAEWSIGEAVGALVAQALQSDLPPRKIRADARLLEDFRRLLSGTLGVPLAWPDDIRTTACGRAPAVPQLVEE